ncbi:unnamed protein product [Microthlaspi erraticum]|uniref:F-box domain-containing protein n=1 Tax=Microthlaspi erraticum TaxID=1685480 RepID=A0A6D2K2D7_9BRAS|nr:unnamed protein product [Microthlaspi erraticum]
MRWGSRAGMDLPFDVEIEILQRLPVRPLRRVELVSKKWRSLIRSPYFKERYLVYQKSKHRLKILANVIVIDPFSRISGKTGLFRSRDDDPQFSYVLLQNKESSSLSCDGVICCPGPGNKFLFINPATLQNILVKEPPLSHRPKTFESHGNMPYTFYVKYYLESSRDDYEIRYPKFHLLGFGRDRVSGDYKLVRLLPWTSWDYNICSECEVFSLKTWQWTYVSSVPIPCPDGQASASVNGSIYWFTVYLWVPYSEYSDYSETAKIIAFDLHTHRFRAVCHPPLFDARIPSSSIKLVNLRDQVWIVEQTPSCLEMWSMDRGGDDAWEKMYSIDLKSCGMSDLEVFTPIEICNYGKVLIKGKKPEDSNHGDLKERLLKYDPRTKTLLLSDHQTFASPPNHQTWVLAPYFQSLFSLF